jgi:hypothetical protein
MCYNSRWLFSTYYERVWSNATSPLPGPQNIPAIIRVTSSNAKATERKVIFHSDFLPDENNHGRIIEFP